MTDSEKGRLEDGLKHEADVVAKLFQNIEARRSGNQRRESGF